MPVNPRSMRRPLRSYISRLILSALLTGIFVNWTQRAYAAPEKLSAPEAAQRLFEAGHRLGDPEFAAHFLRIIGEAGFDAPQRLELWEIIQAAQKDALISLDDLREMIEATRNTIVSIRAETRLTVTVRDATAAPVTTVESHEFAFTGGKLYLKIAPGDGAPSVTRSFDGQVVRSLYGSPVDDKTMGGSIDVLDARSALYRPDSNPVFLGMLADTPTIMNRPSISFDVVELLRLPQMTVAQGRFDFEGTQCVLVTNLTNDVLFDPDRGFAVLRYRAYQDGDLKQRLVLERDIHELFDVGNGLWLPRKITEIQYDRITWKPQREYSIEIENVEVNGDIPDNVFDTIFPVGTIVSDGVRKLTYRTGEVGSIEKLIDGVVGPPLDAPAPRGRRRAWWIFALNGASIALIVAWMLWRRMQLRNRQ